MRPRITICLCEACFLTSGFGFEGFIQATLTQRHESPVPILYTVGTNHVRVENTSTNFIYPRNIVDLVTGDLTLVYPHNRSFVRVKSASGRETALSHATGTGNRMSTGGITEITPGPKAVLRPSGEKTNLLGYACSACKVTMQGRTMEIWATDSLVPFHIYRQLEPTRLGRQGLEEQWADLLKAAKVFPLRAIIRRDAGQELYRFEVQSIEPAKIQDPDGKLFQPPADYHEVQPSTF